jgi:hypothetical protein
MRLLVLAAAATLALTATAMANETAKHGKRVHYRDANASVAEEGAAPADTLGAHELYIMNLRDSGYSPSRDRDAAGNMRTN